MVIQGTQIPGQNPAYRPSARILTYEANGAACGGMSFAPAHGCAEDGLLAHVAAGGLERGVVRVVRGDWLWLTPKMTRHPRRAAIACRALSERASGIKGKPLRGACRALDPRAPIALIGPMRRRLREDGFARCLRRGRLVGQSPMARPSRRGSAPPNRPSGVMAMACRPEFRSRLLTSYPMASSGAARVSALVPASMS